MPKLLQARQLTLAERVANWLSLFVGPDDVTELRALHVTQRYGRPATIAGFFDGRHLADMAAAALELTEQARGVYFVMNPLHPEILARCANRMQLADSGSLAADQHVSRRRWLLIDVDPVRVAGISATDAEKAAARAVADAVRQHLDGRGWPAPIVADSGNGRHLLYRIDLPTDDGEIVQRCLATLAERHDTDGAKVDRSVFNPARIVKVPGTLARKGDATDDRPHRRGYIVETPAELVSVSAELLQALAAEATPPTSAGVPERNGQAHAEQNGRAGGNHWLDVARWLTDRGVGFRVKDAPDAKGRTVFVLAACPLDPNHGDPDACIMQEPSGKLAAHCFHNGCSGRGWQEFKQAIGAPDREHFDPPLPQRSRVRRGERERKPPASAVLIDLASAAELWHATDGTGYATITRGEHREHWRLRSSTFTQWLASRFYEETDGVAPAQAIADARNVLEARASRGPAYEVFLRVGECDGRLYLDLCDDRWRAVEIDAGGWRIVDNPPVRFRRTKEMLPLPEPTRGGSICQLRPFVNVSDDQWPLILAFVLQTLRPGVPCAILVLHGEQGCAKSMTARMLRLLIDPRHYEDLLRGPPRNVDDLVIAADNSWLVTFDNISYLSEDMSDALCRVTTGGSLGKRQLYTDGEEHVIRVKRPVVLTGIEDPGTRSDFLDRCVHVELSVISDERRLTETVLTEKFAKAQAAILGALLDAASAAVRNLPAISQQACRWPRMADFAQWGVAAEEALGLQPDDFMRAYKANRAETHVMALETPLGTAIQEYIGGEYLDATGQRHRRTEVELTATELLSALSLGQDTRAKSWPKSPRVLSGMLKRMAPNLRHVGIEAMQRWRGNDKVWRITRVAPPAPTQPTLTTQKNGPFTDDMQPTLPTLPTLPTQENGPSRGGTSRPTTLPTQENNGSTYGIPYADGPARISPDFLRRQRCLRRSQPADHDADPFADSEGPA